MEPTVESFVVEDGVDSSLDMQVKILFPDIGVDSWVVHLRPAEKPDDPGLSMDTQMLSRIAREVDRRILERG